MIHKPIKKDNIFCLALSIALIFLTLKDTTFALSRVIIYGAVGLSILLVMFEIIYFDIKTNIRNSILGIAFFIASVISFIKIGKGIEILLISIFMIGAYKVDFQKIIKTFLYTNTSVVLLVITSFKLGFISEVVSNRNGVFRHSFGFNWPTDFVSMIVYILLADLYLALVENKKIIWREVLYILLAGFTYIYCNSRLGSFYIILLIPLSVYFHWWCVHQSQIKLRFIKKYFFIICTLLSVAIVLLYKNNPSNSFMFNLNNFSSNRLYLTVNNLNLHGLTLWGQYIYDQTSSVIPSWNFIDSVYWAFLIEYGLILLILFEIIYIKAMNRFIINKQNILIIICMLLCLMAIFDIHFYALEYNVFLLSFSANLPKKNSMNNGNVNFKVRKN